METDASVQPKRLKCLKLGIQGVFHNAPLSYPSCCQVYRIAGYQHQDQFLLKAGLLTAGIGHNRVHIQKQNSELSGHNQHISLQLASAFFFQLQLKFQHHMLSKQAYQPPISTKTGDIHQDPRVSYEQEAKPAHMVRAPTQSFLSGMDA